MFRTKVLLNAVGFLLFMLFLMALLAGLADIFEAGRAALLK